MMKKIVLFLILIFCVERTSYAQEIFIPTKPDHISEADYRNGELMLKNAYQQVAEDDFNILAHDYWNFATAYSKMGQPKENIYDYLFKARYTDRKDFCMIVNKAHERNGIENSGFYKLLGDDYVQLVADCADIDSEDHFDIDLYIKQNKLDKELIYRLNGLLIEDQRFRKDDNNLSDQTVIDKVNIKEAIAILDKYGYPGKTMAGDRFAFVVWIVIQHAELEFQEKHLPIIALAVREKELSKAPLRMLLDRIYTKKTGVQLFGSQIGVPFTDDITIEGVKLKYDL